MTGYLIEIRRTVGAYKVIAAMYNYENAIAAFEEGKKNFGFGKGRPEKHMGVDKKNPDILASAKVGDAHDNLIMRLRKIEIQEEK